MQKDKSGKLSVKNISRKLSSSEKLSATEQKELKKELTRYCYIGDSPASNLCMDVLGAGKNVAYLPKRKKQINHNTLYEIMKNQYGSKRIINLINKNTEISLEISGIERLIGNNKTAKRHCKRVIEMIKIRNGK